MANKFSAVLLGDLNDFIAPGQACINPIFVETKPAVQEGEPSKKKATIELAFDDIPTVTATKSLIKLDKSSKAAKVSLSDCLACSGCVTSAETVLLKQQSVQEFLSTLSAIRAQSHPSFKVAAVSISPQVRASFAVRFNCSPAEVYSKLVTFFKTKLGVEYVLDCGALPSDVAQFQVAQDFVARYRRSKADPKQPSLPLLTSNCPGWVCYAEKTHPHALPYLCEAKSPQQVAGSIIKRSLQAQRGLEPNQVYHVSIMQCPDKKLEGSRKEFWMGPDETCAEVNCVLTATELCDAVIETLHAPNDLELAFLALESNPDLIVTNELERSFRPLTTSEEPKTGGSGGLCGYVFRYAARELFQVEIPLDAQLPFKPGRNPDTWTLDLALEGSVVLRFAASYGFRNIQDTVRRIKNSSAPWHFVEVMACPGGCTNGGGLLVPKDGTVPTTTTSSSSVSNNNNNNSKRALAEAVARAMEQVPRTLVGDNPALVEVVQGDASALKTTFNAVKDIFNSVADPGLMQSW